MKQKLLWCVYMCVYVKLGLHFCLVLVVVIQNNHALRSFNEMDPRIKVLASENIYGQPTPWRYCTLVQARVQH